MKFKLYIFTERKYNILNVGSCSFWPYQLFALINGASVIDLWTSFLCRCKWHEENGILFCALASCKKIAWVLYRSYLQYDNSSFCYRHVLLGSGFCDCFEHRGSKSQALFNHSASRSFLFVALIFVCMFYAVLAFKCSVMSVIVMSITWFVFVLSLPPLTTGELGEMLLMLKLAIFLQMFNKLVWWEILFILVHLYFWYFHTVLHTMYLHKLT